MERIIRLKDGTEITCEMCGEFDGQLWIAVSIGMADAWAVFTDKGRIETITDTYAGDDGKLREIVWEGYTDLFSLVNNGSYTQIGLKKG